MRLARLVAVLVAVGGLVALVLALILALPERTLNDRADELWRQLERGEYKAVEAELQRAIERREKTDDGRSVAIQTIQRWVEPVRIERLKTLNAWCEARPGSAHALTSRGAFYRSYAWEGRSAKFTQDVTDEQQRSFSERLPLALQDLSRAYELDQTNPVTLTLWIGVLIGERLADGDVIMEDLFQKATTLDPELYEAYYAKLKYLMPKWHGTWERLFEFAKAAREGAPPSSLRHLLLPLALREGAYRAKDEAAYYQAPGIWEEIEAGYRSVIEAYPHSAHWAWELAEIAHSAQRLDDAQRYYDLAVRQDPSHALAQLTRGWFYGRRRNDNETALRSYEQAIALDPSFADAYYRRGTMRVHRSDPAGAEADYRKAIELDPEHDWAHNVLGNLFQQQHKYAEAVEEYTRAIDLDPDIASHHEGRAYAHLSLGHYAESETDSSKALALDPSKAKTWYLRGYARIGLRKYREAIADYTECIRLDPMHLDAHVGRAWLYEQVGDAEKAAQDHQKIRELQGHR